jgi:hypothetical protein
VARWVPFGSKIRGNPGQRERSAAPRVNISACPARRAAGGADPALAKYLVERFDTDAWFYEMTDTTDQAYAKRYGREEEVVRNAESVMELIASLPHPFLYFDKVREDLEEAEIAAFRVIAFEGIPHRPQARYSGPNASQLASNLRVVRAKKLAERRNAAGLRALADEDAVLVDVILDAVREADLRQPADTRFVLELGDVVLAEGHSCAVKPSTTFTYPQRYTAMADLAVLALQCDMTRVVSLHLGCYRNDNHFDFLGATKNRHTLSHYRGASHDPSEKAQYVKTCHWLCEQMAYLFNAKRHRLGSERERYPRQHALLRRRSAAAAERQHGYLQLAGPPRG